MKSLATALGMDRTTLTRNLKPMERRGWIAFHGDEDDRRLRGAAITAQGMEIALAALPRWREAQTSAASLLERLGIELRL